MELERNVGDLRMAIPLLLCVRSRCTAKDLWTRLAPGGGLVLSPAVLSTRQEASTLSKPLKDLQRPVQCSLGGDLTNTS